MSEPSMSITKEDVKVTEVTESDNSSIPDKIDKIPDKLTLNDAVSILLQAVSIAQHKGAFAIRDSALLYKSIQTVVDNKEYIKKCN